MTDYFKPLAKPFKKRLSLDDTSVTPKCDKAEKTTENGIDVTDESISKKSASCDKSEIVTEKCDNVAHVLEQ